MFIYCWPHVFLCCCQIDSRGTEYQITTTVINGVIAHRPHLKLVLVELESLLHALRLEKPRLLGEEQLCDRRAVSGVLELLLRTLQPAPQLHVGQFLRGVPNQSRQGGRRRSAGSARGEGGAVSVLYRQRGSESSEGRQVEKGYKSGEWRWG